MNCSPARAPKSPLAIEQPSTGGHWNPPKKDIPCPKTYMIVAQLVKNPPGMWETWVQSLGWEDPLEKGNASHSNILAWRIPWTTARGITKSWTRLSDFHFHFMGFPDSSVGKESTCNARDPSFIPESGRFAEEGIGYPFQYC